MPAKVEFSINGIRVRPNIEDPETTLLDHLRIEQGLVGTKEGCNEGDCGACTVIVSERHGGMIEHKAVNSCILFLPQLHGKAVRTVEGVAETNGSPNCVQRAMISHHASQCGFCTPGIVMSLVAGHLNRNQQHDDVLAGNLCRCTGYEPIVRSAQEAFGQDLPHWSGCVQDDIPEASGPVLNGAFHIPGTLDEFAAWYAANPAATIVAGATDTGLWVTKQLRSIKPVCFIGHIAELRTTEVVDGVARVGACVTLAEFGELIESSSPSLAELIRRFGSVQVRNSATIGGNVANGSPIGDASPALIALGASLCLRKAGSRRRLAIEDFFIEYGKQDIAPGEFLEAIEFPVPDSNFKCYKISKRFDQDISAVCGCFNIEIEDGKVRSARLAFGGMAATPKRAKHAESAMIGNPWNTDTVRNAMGSLADDFAPISDMRASAEYRMEAARNLLLHYHLEATSQLGAASVLEIAP